MHSLVSLTPPGLRVTEPRSPGKSGLPKRNLRPEDRPGDTRGAHNFPWPDWAADPVYDLSVCQQVMPLGIMTKRRRGLTLSEVDYLFPRNAHSARPRVKFSQNARQY